MSFDDRLRHTLTVRRLAPTAELDGYGQPVSAVETLGTVPGLVQPRRAREVALASQEGAAIGDHACYMRPLDGLGTDCWVELDGARYDVLSIADAGGVGHHLELGLQRVS
jgi:hypothetical protein